MTPMLSRVRPILERTPGVLRALLDGLPAELLDATSLLEECEELRQENLTVLDGMLLAGAQESLTIGGERSRGARGPRTARRAPGCDPSRPGWGAPRRVVAPRREG